MPVYTEREYNDMIRCFEAAGGRSSNAAANLYRQRFPNRRHPDHRVFTRLMIRDNQGGHVVPPNDRAGAPRRVRNPRVEERIIRHIRNNPRIGLRQVASNLNLSYTTVQATVKEAG